MILFLMVESRIAPYFKELGLSLREITGDETNDFYAYLRNEILLPHLVANPTYPRNSARREIASGGNEKKFPRGLP